MSRLVDQLKAAERKRRASQAQGPAAATATPAQDTADRAAVAQLDEERRLIEQAQARAAAELEAAAAAECDASMQNEAAALARVRTGLRSYARPSALAAVAFALGIGAAALWREAAIENRATLPGATAAIQQGSTVAQPPPASALKLRLDADHAAFAVRAAARARR